VRVLAVNAGSTSLKLHLVDGDHATPVDELVDADAVGHRVVHGGARFREPVLLDDSVERAIDELSVIAPLHNVPALEAIREARRTLPDVPHVAVFDTAFHATLPERASTYAVPARWRDEWGVRRYGFHGLSVEWVASQARARRLVVCHLGGGCSVTAVLDGRSVDTTMGFSPLEGVPMATRSGSVDPGALLYLLRERSLSADDLDHALEHESGLLALGGSTDPRELAGTLALDVYSYRIACAVGALAVALGGLDALAFTGGVGEGSADVRARISTLLGFLGDFEVVVVPAREEVVIARTVERVLGG
jgi:acetate kinase